MLHISKHILSFQTGGKIKIIMFDILEIIRTMIILLIIYILSLNLIECMVNKDLIRFKDVSLCGYFTIKDYNNIDNVYISKLNHRMIYCIDSENHILESLGFNKQYYITGKSRLKIYGIIIPKCCYEIKTIKIDN